MKYQMHELCCGNVPSLSKLYHRACTFWNIYKDDFFDDLPENDFFDPTSYQTDGLDAFLSDRIDAQSSICETSIHPGGYNRRGRGGYGHRGRGHSGRVGGQFGDNRNGNNMQTAKTGYITPKLNENELRSGSSSSDFNLNYCIYCSV